MSISPDKIEKTVEEFREHLAGDKRSKYTVKQYSHFLLHFLRFINKEPEKVSAEDIERFKQYLAIEKQYAKNSIYIAIKAIQAFLKFKGIRIEEISAPKRSQQLPKYLNEEETHALIESAKGDARDYAILRTLAYTGLRVGELCNLEIEDIDFAEGIIHVRSGKGDKDRIVVLEEGTAEALKRYLAARYKKDVNTNKVFISRKNQPISPLSVERLVKKYGKKAGILKKVTPHVLRHTLATTLLNHGADIRFIQTLLGHASVSTTQIYTHLDNENLRKMYQKTKPSY
ncbi:MAG: tyrosine-type recombinase/integrase [Thermoplasmata archaeon]|nr:tyrosine-type recombinase/integrase [Thermoplasmata archaeon]